MDYSKLSDAQLLALHSGDYSKLSNSELTDLHAHQTGATTPGSPINMSPDTANKVEPGLNYNPQAQPNQPPEGTGHWVGRQLLGLLPAAGAAVGATLGAPEGGIGAIPVGAAGYTAGKVLENMGRKYLLGDQLPRDPGGPMGAVAGTVGEGLDASAQGEGLGTVLSPVAQAIASRLKGFGISQAVRHLRPTPTVARAMGDNLNNVGEAALQSGSIKPFQTVGSTAERLADSTEQAGNDIGKIVKNSPARVNPQAINDAVNQNVISPLEATTAGKKVAAPVRAKLNDLMQDLSEDSTADGVPVSRIEAEKSAEQGANNYLLQSKGAKAADKAYASQLRQASEDAIKDQDPESYESFLAAKQKYGNLKAARDMAQRTAGLTDGGTGLMGHITDTGMLMEGIDGLATGNPVKAAAPIARGLVKGRVASTLAAGGYGAGNMLQSASRFANPVAQAISARMESSSPRGEPIQDSASIRQNLIDQQTNPAAQKDLKDSQE